MGKKSRSKGRLGEQELVNHLKAEGYPAFREWQNGEGYEGDIRVLWRHLKPPVSELEVQMARDDGDRVEVKRRAQGFKKIDEWLADGIDAVCYRRDRGEWCVTMRLSKLLKLLRGEF